MFRPNNVPSFPAISGLLLACAGSVALGQTPDWDGPWYTDLSARHAHVMAYDSFCGRVVLFGGPYRQYAL